MSSEVRVENGRQRTMVARMFRVISFQGVILSLFLYCSVFKADARLDWIPVDITVLLGLALIAVMYFRLVHGLYNRDARTFGIVMFLFVLLLAPCLWTDWMPYSTEKVYRLFTLTLISAVAPFVIVRNRVELRQFIFSLVVVVIVIGANSLAEFYFIPTRDTFVRLGSVDSNPIAVARALGVALITISLLLFEGKVGIYTYFLLVAPLCILEIATGSKGPLLSILVTISISIVLFYLRSRKTAIKALFAVGVIPAFLYFGMTLAPTNSVDRIALLFSSDFTQSESDRIHRYNSSVDGIWETPMGGGWGYYAIRYGSGGSETDYPHNLVLELLLETGWLSGGLVCIILLFALFSSWRQSSRAEDRIATSLFGYFILCALVSSDINGNKSLFAFLTLALLIGNDWCRESDLGVEGSTVVASLES